MSPRSSHWWPGFVAALKNRPLRSLARELGVPEAELIAGLIEADPKGPASEAPWWPEALRLRAQLSLRELARRFGTEPRRVRRSLARAGLRAGGQELGGRGVPALAPLAARLGHEPDATLAREAGVAVEAVQGERARLGIPPFRPGVTLALTAEEEAWIRGPQRERRLRPRTDADALQVVRRPVRTGDDEGTRMRTHSTPPGTPAAGPHPPYLPGVARPTEPAPREAPAAARVARGFFQERERTDIDRLLTPTRPRDGRQRIVRMEPLRPPLLPPELPAVPRGRPTAERSAWRASTVSAAALEVSAVPAAPAPAPVAVGAPGGADPAPVPQPTPDSEGAETFPLRHALSAWHVRLPGEEAPMVVHASDLAGAAEVAARFLPRESWRGASIFLADGERAPAP